MAEPMCQILLDNQWNTFDAGGVITGHVKIHLVKEKTVRSIVIQFLGEARTDWAGCGGHSDFIHGHEVYLKHKQYLLGDKNTGTITLLPGKYVYPFSCAIPPTAPCSFEGKIGHVRYTAKVILNRPWKLDQGSKMAFTVVSPFDLNQNQLLKQPTSLTLHKTFSCIFSRSGPLTVVVHLPSTGFVPGQIVPIGVDIDNASNVGVSRVRISLRQYTTFKTTSPNDGTRSLSNTISEVSLEPITRGRIEKNTYYNKIVDITVPSTTPSNLLFCNLIDLEYSLKVECFVSGLHGNLKGRIPIVIGTVPFIDVK